jgi:hypothetical protein
VNPLVPNAQNLPSDSATLQVMVLGLQLERDQEKQRAEGYKSRAEEHKLRNEQLQVELLRTQLELERFKKMNITLAPAWRQAVCK